MAVSPEQAEAVGVALERRAGDGAGRDLAVDAAVRPPEVGVGDRADGRRAHLKRESDRAMLAALVAGVDPAA